MQKSKFCVIFFNMTDRDFEKRVEKHIKDKLYQQPLSDKELLEKTRDLGKELDCSVKKVTKVVKEQTEDESIITEAGFSIKDDIYSYFTRQLDGCIDMSLRSYTESGDVMNLRLFFPLESSESKQKAMLDVYDSRVGTPEFGNGRALKIAWEIIDKISKDKP